MPRPRWRARRAAPRRDARTRDHRTGARARAASRAPPGGWRRAGVPGARPGGRRRCSSRRGAIPDRPWLRNSHRCGMPPGVSDTFVKGHALGNDYLVVEPASLSFALTPDAVRRLCDRHRGVGGDGVLALVPSDRADAGLRIFNPDGSEAEKSGNGLRIFARWLVEDGRVPGERFRVETPGGIVECRMRREDGRIADITVDMGAASFRSED